MPFWIEVLVSVFLIIGSLFALIGAIGLYRLPDFLHAFARADQGDHAWCGRHRHRLDAVLQQPQWRTEPA